MSNRSTARHPMRLAQMAVGLALSLSLTTPVMAQDEATPANDGGTGTVYAMTNSPIRNEIMVFNRAEDGTLSPGPHVDTRGMGSGAFENSDTAMVVASAEGQSSPVDLGGGSDLLFAVNAGSDTISVFRVTDDGLEFVEQQESGGERPTSLTVRNGLLYVLNSAGDGGGAGLCFGGNPMITGFTVAGSGELEPIAGSTRELSGGPSSGCAQVSFNPDGDVLIVSQITADTLTTFTVDDEGLPGEAIENDPVGNGPFGYTFDDEGRLLVTENFQAAPGMGAVATYEIGDDATLTAVGESVAHGETDPCWIVTTPDGRYAFVANFGPSPLLTVESDAVRRGTISSFLVGDDGSLEPLDAEAAQLGVGAADIALAGDGGYLYALNSVAGTVSGFRVEDDGGLTLITAVGGLPTNAFAPVPLNMGLATRDAG